MKHKGPICSSVWPTGKVKSPNGGGGLAGDGGEVSRSRSEDAE